MARLSFIKFWQGSVNRINVVAAYLLIAVAFAYGQVQDAQQRKLIQDGNCQYFERDHLADVETLKNTYKYLAQLTEKEKQEPLNRFILAALPQTEKEAMTDEAPKTCDEPGYGLPEPDPVLPKRPAALR